MKTHSPQSCLPLLFHHPFCTARARQAGCESSYLILILVLALQVNFPTGKLLPVASSRQKNLTHLSPTFRIKTILSISSRILTSSCLEFPSGWICEMRALLTSPHCCFQRGSLGINIMRFWIRASGSFPEG